MTTSLSESSLVPLQLPVRAAVADQDERQADLERKRREAQEWLLAQGITEPRGR